MKIGGLKMRARKVELGKNFFARAEPDSDIITFVTELAKKHKIMLARFTVIGALKSAKL